MKLNLLKYCLAENNLCLSILVDHDQLFCDRLVEDNMLGVSNCILGTFDRFFHPGQMLQSALLAAAYAF